MKPYSMMIRKLRAEVCKGLLVVVVLLGVSILGADVSRAAVLFDVNPDDSPTACNGAVPGTGEWDYRGGSINGQFYVRCDTPVPGTTKYYRVDTVNLQHDSYNIADFGGQIALSSSTTYYFGGFFRFDKVAGQDIWHDGAQADSYDKMFELYGGANGSSDPTAFRALITAGWHYGYYNQAHDGKYTYGAYLSPGACDTRPPCEYELVGANVSPYGQNNPYVADYGKWYAVVMSVKPSTGLVANGLIEVFINGTKIYSQVGATQNGTIPDVESFQYTGTTAQPAYDAPAHLRKLGRVMLTNSLSDITTAGMMQDPESGGDTTPPAAPTGLGVQ
ncbi:MAG: hypothetical protein WBO92_02570 [Candidatus Moraniibacteriota bacterium]